jgi:two-component system, chemotaxis family, protein-glutamate methylesterase/glutaminase
VHTTRNSLRPGLEPHRPSMMRRIRVLIVDDSVTIRKLISDLVSAQPELEVAGVAANGRIALAKIPQVCPDVITLDLEMPELDGLQTLAEIRKTHPHLPVIMFSSLTERAAAATLDALSLGANDYVTKPSGASGLAGAMQRVRDELVPKLRHFGAPAVATSASPIIRSLAPAAGSSLRASPQFGSWRATALAGASRSAALAGASSLAAPVVSSRPGPPARSLQPGPPARSLQPGPPAARMSNALSRPRSGIDIIAFGSSTGGPNALSQIFARLHPTLPVPVVITQHMPPIFTKLLAERLTSTTPFTVHEARDGDVLVPGQAWLAPGDHHLSLHRVGTEVRIRLTTEPPENSCRPAVDVMFRSVAAVYGGRALGVILTGMGQDGLRGCQELHDLGAEIVVQDQATSVVWGMPGLVARAGLASAVVPVGRVADEVIRLAGVGRNLSLPTERRA